MTWHGFTSQFITLVLNPLLTGFYVTQFIVQNTILVVKDTMMRIGNETITIMSNVSRNHEISLETAKKTIFYTLRALICFICKPLPHGLWCYATLFFHYDGITLFLLGVETKYNDSTYNTEMNTNTLNHKAFDEVPSPENLNNHQEYPLNCWTRLIQKSYRNFIYTFNSRFLKDNVQFLALEM